MLFSRVCLFVWQFATINANILGSILCELKDCGMFRSRLKVQDNIYIVDEINITYLGPPDFFPREDISILVPSLNWHVQSSTFEQNNCPCDKPHNISRHAMVRSTTRMQLVGFLYKDIMLRFVELQVHQYFPTKLVRFLLLVMTLIH